MISVKDAFEAVESTPFKKIEVEQIVNSNLLGSVLSQPIYSPFDLPRFDLSAMDGYAVKLGKTEEFILLEKEITAGSGNDFHLNPGEAIRIFTGAPCPSSADAVVIQEQSQVINGKLIVSNPIKHGQNIRRRGEEIKKAEVVLQKGQILNPAAIGLIASLGKNKATIYSTPTFGILTTGDELTTPGKELKPGKIYDSNSYLLEAFLRSQNINKINTTHVPDDFEITKTKIGETLKQNDVLLISGGISVGDYDFVKQALLENGVEEIFHKVKQKPGMPLFFGRKANKFVFGLPGNPASALTNAYLYVLPLIKRFKGIEPIHLERLESTSKTDFKKKPGRAQFLKARFTGNDVEILEGQGSGMLQSFAKANALVYLPEDNAGINSGDKVKTIDLRGAGIL